MAKIKYLAFDTETGGFDPANNSLLSICFAAVDADLNIAHSVHYLLKPDDGVYKLTAGAMNVNKIDIVKHDQAAMTYSQAREFLLSFMKSSGCDKPLQLGYNIPFDQDFIYQYLFSRQEWNKLVSYRKLDVCDAVRYEQDKGRLPVTLGSLTSVAEYFKIPVAGAHTADKDVEITVETLKRMRLL